MNIDQLVTALLQSIANRNLAILAGAGLSMAAPSNAPGAAAVANQAVRRHRERTGEELPTAIAWDLEKVSQHFFHEGNLSTYFVHRLVDWTPFRLVPNRGHLAIADFLACGVIDIAITTNYDELVEMAARRVGEINFQNAWDGVEANQAYDHQPYLKIYGCCRRDVANTVWCVEQTEIEPLATRLERSKQFLRGRLLNRDLLIIGFWSDWNYLNSILEDALPPTANGRIYLVDPLPDDRLREKAEDLWAWANQHRFTHVEAPGDEVLDRIRRRFSQLMLRRVMRRAGEQAPLDWVDALDTEESFTIRRDLAGVNGVARQRDDTASMTAFARAHERLRIAGAQYSGGRYSLGARNFRIIQAAGVPLAEVRAEFEAAPELSLDLDAVVCAGAEDDAGLAGNVVRTEGEATIIRGGSRDLRLHTSADDLLNEEMQ